MKSIVCIKQSFPKSNTHECECLDLIMALASFDYTIHLVFMGDGILSLLQSEYAYSKRLQALPLFDITNIGVESQSFYSRQLDRSQLSIPVSIVEPKHLQQLLQDSIGVYTL